MHEHECKWLHVSAWFSVLFGEHTETISSPHCFWNFLSRRPFPPHFCRVHTSERRCPARHTSCTWRARSTRRRRRLSVARAEGRGRRMLRTSSAELDRSVKSVMLPAPAKMPTRLTFEEPSIRRYTTADFSAGCFSQKINYKIDCFAFGCTNHFNGYFLPCVGPAAASKWLSV